MMNFNQKLEKQFQSISITALQEAKYNYHLYADYVEIVCLFTDGYVSKEDIIDRLTDEGVQFSPEDNTLDGETGLRETEISDAQEGWINTIYELIFERTESFGASYPFDVDDIGIKLIEDEKTQIQLLYLYLLISSSLKYFKKVQSILTSEFEVLSGKVLKEYLPEKAIVKQFGYNSDYYGNAITKIRKLAIELNIETDDYELNQISDYNSKEEGLDIIGWIPFEDKNPNLLIVLGQCGCGKEWDSKKFETSRYENFYHFYKQPPIHTLFVPYALSNMDGKFYQSKDIIKPTLIFERGRMLEYSHNVDFINSFQSNKIVEKCIEYCEDIV